MRWCVICDDLLDNRYPTDVSVCMACEKKRMARNPLPAAPDAKTFITESRWVLAKTMLDIPHQYVVRDLQTPDGRKSTCRTHAEFEWFAELTQQKGERKRWGKYNNAYLTIGEWEYWTMMYVPQVTTIINRQAVGPRAIEYMERLVDEARKSGRRKS